MPDRSFVEHREREQAIGADHVLEHIELLVDVFQDVGRRFTKRIHVLAVEIHIQVGTASPSTVSVGRTRTTSITPNDPRDDGDHDRDDVRQREDRGERVRAFDIADTDEGDGDGRSSRCSIDANPVLSGSETQGHSLGRMCRNITELRGLEPEATPEEIEAVARQYIRKVSGITRPRPELAVKLEAAAMEVAAITTRVLAEVRARMGLEPLSVS